MKNIKFVLLLLAAGIFTACSGDNATGPGNSGSNTALTKAQKEEVKERFAKISKVAVYNHTMDKIILLDPKMEKSGFEFADPNDGWNFGTTDNIEFVEGPDGTEVVFISANGGAGSGAGGVVTAGPSTLTIDFAFCFSADSETAFAGLDTGGDDIPFDGISGVFGFAGDLEALANDDFEEEDDIFEYFQGWAYYWVYADEANGSYEILDWLDYDSYYGGEDLDDEGFAFVYDFQEGNVFWSLDGTLNVSGGSMTFNGEYFAWLGFLDLLFDGEEFEGSYEEVDGYGSMGCD